MSAPITADPQRQVRIAQRPEPAGSRSYCSEPGPKHLLPCFPELLVAERWIAEEGPWIKGLLAFGWLASWRMNSPLRTLNMASLHRLTLLNLGEEGERRMYSLLQEHAEKFSNRWPGSNGETA